MTSSQLLPEFFTTGLWAFDLVGALLIEDSQFPLFFVAEALQVAEVAPCWRIRTGGDSGNPMPETPGGMVLIRTLMQSSQGYSQCFK